MISRRPTSIAHEIGHHVQNLLGISSKVQRAPGRASRARRPTSISVRTELQADCFAGVWAYHANRTRQLLEPGDVEEGLRAAAAIGDDTLQKAARGRVVPESFTHGSAAQRVKWFKTGMKSGQVRDCDTFQVTGSSADDVRLRGLGPRASGPQTSDLPVC